MTNWRLSIIPIAYLLILPVYIYAQSPYRDACTKNIENRVDACTSGKESVWHYTFSGPKDGGNVSRSWGYKSREAAQRALDNDKQLCQTVDRYFEKTDCQTTYGTIFCAGCGATNRNPRQYTIEESEIIAAGERQLSRWRKEIQRAIRNVRSAEKTGQPRPNLRFGNVLREYVGELRAARGRALSLEKLMNSVLTQGSIVLKRLSTAINELGDSTEHVEAGNGKLLEVIAEINPQPNSDLSAPKRNSEKMLLGGKWPMHVFDFYGSPLRQSVTLESNRLKVTVQPINSAIGDNSIRTYIVNLSDLVPEKQTFERVEPNLWVVTIFTSGRKVSDVISSSNDSIKEQVSRIKLFFSNEDAAREAANSLSSLSSK
jgi:hypothetical protein